MPKNLTLITLVFLTGIFSFWLMFSTFSYSDGDLILASKVWSDFASHIPLIRSFSLGNNLPPQYPLFSGPVIKYHFLFYFIVGTLEKIGLRIDLALNILSALGFWGLLIVIYYFGKDLFKDTRVGILSIIFLLFNGSLSFINFFQNHPLSLSIFKKILTNTQFPSFGPYDGGLISAFWNLNIYTNQRHLAISYFLGMLIIYLTIKPILKNQDSKNKLSIILGILLGLFPFLHLAVFVMITVILLGIFLLFKKIRKGVFITLLIGGILGLPQYLYYISVPSISPTIIYLGFLSPAPFEFISFLKYWFLNFGLYFLLIPLGIALSSPTQRKFALCFIPLFFIGNLFKFSPEIAANHKFFNLFLIFGSFYVSSYLMFIWDKIKLLRPLLVMTIILLILSGVIDIFPIINDGKIHIPDYQKDTRANWIKNNTPKSAVFLNSEYIFDPASLAGRKIYLGWPYFAWSQGYDTDTRSKTMAQILASNKDRACDLLLQNAIDYIEIQPIHLSDPNYFPISSTIPNNFVLVYQDKTINYSIYSVSKSCLTSI